MWSSEETNGSTYKRGRLAATALCLVVLSGCGARYLRIAEKGMTCAEAHGVAIAAVRRLGYEIADVTKPTPGAPGVITGVMDRDGSKRSVLVQVFCTQLGAEVEAKAEGGGLADLNFTSEFKRTFEAAVKTRPPVRKAADTGIDVLLTIERADGSGLGVNLSDAGLLPVSVRISNQTDRVYGFRVKGVTLETADGSHVKAVTVDSLATKLDAAAVAALHTKVLSDRNIAAKETVTGFLLFPFKSYTRARVVLTDRQAGEPEGFSIEL